ncbi:MAG: class I SAM-dependent methyltransferase [Candidatus Jordarchaeales archaeon]
MTLEGKVKVSLRLLKNLGSLTGVAKLTRMHNALSVAVGLEKIGVIEFLEEPKSLKEVADFIGDVKRLDLLEAMFEALVEEKVLKKVDGRYTVNVSQLEKLKAMRRTNPYFKEYEVFTAGFEGVMNEVMIDVLRGRDFDFVSPEVATILYFQTSSKIYALGRELLLELGGGKGLKGKKILDLGCGFGTEPITILKYLDFDCHLICADFFPNVVDECMHTTIEINGQTKILKDLDNVEFVVLDPMMKKPFPIPDDYVDAVFSFGLLHWSSHPKEIIKECSRVLKSKGIFMTVTQVKRDEETHLTMGDVLLKIIGGNRYYTKSEIKGFLTEAGLTDPTIFLSYMITARKT